MLQTQDIIFNCKKGVHFYPNLGAQIHNGCQYFYGNKKHMLDKEIIRYVSFIFFTEIKNQRYL